MAYGREQLRKAGQKLLNMDRAYAEAVGNAIEPGDVRYRREATPVADIMGSSRSGYMADKPGAWMGGDKATEVVNPWTGARTQAQPVIIEDRGAQDTINDLLLLSGNLGVRYGLPAAGLTFAGKGLYDMTAAFGNGADYPEEGQLPL